MNRKVILFSLLGVMCLAVIVYWFLHTFEYRTEEKSLGYTLEAYQNPYLASERFLEKFGMKTRSFTSMIELKKLPDINVVLFIPTGRHDISQQRLEQLLAWVRKGGHLVVRTRSVRSGEKNIDDELMNKLGVKTMRKMKKEDSEYSNNWAIVDVKINSKIEDKQVQFDENTWMVNVGKLEPSWQVDGKNGSQVLEYHLGDGYISVLSDMRFMLNQWIGKHDHAAFLYTLIHMNDHTHGMWLVRNDDLPSLIGVVADAAPSTLVMLGILLVFWLWYVTRRFGPLHRPEGIARRSLREHIVAIGNFQWRNKNRAELFRNARTALLEQVAQARPPWAALEATRLAERLARLAGLSSDRVLAVLQATTVEKENEFAHYIEIISLIRKKL